MTLLFDSMGWTVKLLLARGALLVYRHTSSPPSSVHFGLLQASHLPRAEPQAPMVC